MPHSEDLDELGFTCDTVVEVISDATHANPSDIWQCDIPGERADVWLSRDEKAGTFQFFSNGVWNGGALLSPPSVSLANQFACKLARLDAERTTHSLLRSSAMIVSNGTVRPCSH